MGTLYRQRRAGAVVLHGNGGVLPGLSDKTNGLPTDDMSMREDTRTQFSPASPRWGPRGRGQSLLRDPQNSSGAKPATGASPWTEPALPPGFGSPFGVGNSGWIWWLLWGGRHWMAGLPPEDRGARLRDWLSSSRSQAEERSHFCGDKRRRSPMDAIASSRRKRGAG